jgi:hypothetical protein
MGGFNERWPMKSRVFGTLSRSSMLGVGIGMLAGVAAGLLVAPMRGNQMRESLRSRADGALDRGLKLLEDGRRAFRTRRAASGTPLTAPLGEIAQTGRGSLSFEARS